MNLILVLLIGAGIGALGAAGIFFEPREPYKVQIFIAGTLKGLILSLLTGLSLTARNPWWYGVGYGLLYGLVLGLMVFLAKGGFRSMSAPYVVPASIVEGLLIGALLWRFAIHR